MSLELRELVRQTMNAVMSARRWASVLGPEHERIWPLLALAAQAETAALNVEAHLDRGAGS